MVEDPKAFDKPLASEYEDCRVKFLALFERIYHLNTHLIAGLTVHSDVSKEMNQRCEILKESLEKSDAQVRASSQSAKELQTGLEAKVLEINKLVIKRLEEICGHLNEKIDRTTQLLSIIDSVSQQSKTISFRIKIEAVRFGEKAKPFLAIAEDIKKMADETMASSQEASRRLRLEDFREEINAFMSETSQGLQDCTDYVNHAAETLDQIFHGIGSELSIITDHNQIIFEFLRSDLTRHLMKKTAFVSDLSKRAKAFLSHSTPEAQTPAVKEILSETLNAYQIMVRPDYDRLDDILKRGFIRIAIEPDFKGVSFRTNPGEPLQGLDIEYITEFAKWLGVKIEYLEYPWDFCPELLDAGSDREKPAADIMWSALIPMPALQYRNVAYSETYTCLEYILARRKGDTRIHKIEDLEGKILGCIRDPAAMDTLQRAGLRWANNRNISGGKIQLGNLVAYSDQSRIHECLASGRVDAFAVDKPIYYWACNSPESPWYGKIEILPGNLDQKPWIYAVGAAANKSSYKLLKKINEFILWFKTQPERQAIEIKWQGAVMAGTRGYRDQHPELLGESDLSLKK